jgi:hypothetical protein
VINRPSVALATLPAQPVVFCATPFAAIATEDPFTMNLENIFGRWVLVSLMREDIRMPSPSDQFVKLAKSEMVRRASQAMATNRPPVTDEEFQQLLERLSQAEANR